MASVKLPQRGTEAIQPAHRHACERCGGLYMRAGKGECSRIEHDMPNDTGIVVYGYCDAVCYRGGRPLHSREDQQIPEGREP